MKCHLNRLVLSKGWWLVKSSGTVKIEQGEVTTEVSVDPSRIAQGE